MTENQPVLAVIGLGYVGLPLAVAFGRHRATVGYDIKAGRIAELKAGHDATLEVDSAGLTAARHLTLTDDVAMLERCGIFIVTVPTPIDRAKRPDLVALKAASEEVGRAMRPGALVIYESTVYPGCTREVCVPILEATSGLVFDRDFSVGYSPERMNPGDRTHRLDTIVKVTSGSTPEAAERVDALYREVALAGTHKAASIEIAEAAKVIENTQRDLNIALMNELAVIFGKLGIDTGAVLEAAGTKWNFLPFRPGLVGGHCIGVDPYYLTHRAQEIGHNPEVILAGRRINDSMGPYVVDRVARLMMGRKFPVVGSRVLVMGAAYKENTPDLRNSRALDIAIGLKDLNAEVEVWDPFVAPEEVQRATGCVAFAECPSAGRYDAIVIAVPHRQFAEAGITAIRALGRPGAVVYDVKSLYPASQTDGRL
ncbi:nucleotide sugar dehydrogenase [Aurantimonas sp. VKM B-3413]|uniref:nucleotide sugar dehydrogenase n=1 Tax=Aurantimonas sp. VKM B-3413 TaxID=2779401 RepID=UPI001E4C36DF|nr:nucleotide sugar dehydrogenase [Aurantimonas sp. VKM B-3413]MCB8836719.1 nucleotide sugar dehydrogenase [Aurantimonas sp. VKM B-3413]